MNPKRFRNTRVLRSLGAIAGIGLLTVSAMAQEDCYRIIDLGELGFTPSENDIFGINNANQAVFTAVVAGEKHAMLYLPVDAFGLAAGVHDLHDLAGSVVGDASAAHDINSAGIVVGWAGIEVSPNTFQQHAFVWRLDLPQHDFIDLGLFPGGTSSVVYAINNDTPFPMMVGDGDRPGDCGCDPNLFSDAVRRGFALELTDPPDPLDDAAVLESHSNLPGPGCYPSAFVRDVKSQAGLTVAGFSAKSGDCAVPVGCGAPYAGTAWINPTPGTNAGSALAALDPTHHEDPGGTQAWGVSDTGAMVGYGFDAATSPCKQHAAYWHDAAADPPLDLGLASAMDPSAQTLAVRINNNQSPETLQAVGWKLASPDLAFLWECDGDCSLLTNWSATDLNDTIQHCSDFWSIRQAHDVNDNGWIIGWADANEGGPADFRAVILFPDQDCQVCCLADLDCDGDVGVKDLLILLGSWGPCPAPPAPCDADLDCDGTVGVLDLLILLGEWGPCGAAIASGVPQTIQDCMDRFSAESEDELALIKCLETVSQ